MTLTPDQQKIADYLKGRHIPKGMGTAEAACSIAAINLALTGQLTDKIPDCMSLIIGRWIITVQDVMPDDMRNSDRWRELLPLAAGTGRDHEKQRLDMILEWMWGTVLPPLQPVADAHGFGDAWRHMLNERTADAADAAAHAADAAHAAHAADAAYAAYAAYAAHAADAAYAAYAAYAADAAYAAYAADAAAYAAAWKVFDPCALLHRLIHEVA